MLDADLLHAVIDLCRQVGDYQLQQFRSLGPGSGNEKDAREFVAAVDINSQDMLKEALARLLPEAGFYGEETGQEGNAELRWIIDPIDGTTNYLSGLDQFCISVALEVTGRSDLGVIWRPASAEGFSAIRGQGLHHHGLRCRQASFLPLKHALIGTGFPYRSADLADPAAAAFAVSAQQLSTLLTWRPDFSRGSGRVT